MSRYTLKTFYGSKQLEVFEHRASPKLRTILAQSKHQCPGATDAWGNLLGTADRFEILNSMREVVFNGNIVGATSFASKLR